MLSEFFDGKSLNKRINPDEAVAIGATIKAGMLSKSSGEPDCTIDDVIPKSLGILVNGEVSTIFEKNETIPCSKTREFKTQCND